MDSYDSVLSEEWLWSNVLTADFYDATDQLHDDIRKGAELKLEIPDYAPITDQLAPVHFDSNHINDFNISWLDDEVVTNLAHIDTGFSQQSPVKIEPLDDVLIASTPKLPKLVETFQPVPEEPHFSTIEINDLNILHLPEPSAQEAALIILEALIDPNTGDLTQDLLSVAEVESILSSPPCSPCDDSVVPGSPPVAHSPAARVSSLSPALSSVSDTSFLANDGDEYLPAYSRKRKSSTTFYSPREKVPKANRKERKKEQNKTAATKYRIKKRDETVTTKQDVDILETRNTDLKKLVDSLSSEISYMKSLLNDVLEGKGVKIT